MENRLHIVQRSARSCFYRGETAKICLELINFYPHNLLNVILEAKLDNQIIFSKDFKEIGPFQTLVDFEIDTASINSDKYTIDIVVSSEKEILASSNIKFWIALPIRKNDMKLWHWPATVHYNALELSREAGKKQLELLAGMGFNWVQFRASWAIKNFDKTVELIEEAMMLGIELGILVDNNNAGQFRYLPTDKESARLTTIDGVNPMIVNAFEESIENRNVRFVEHLLTLFREFPSCSTIFMNSEIEDKLKLPYDEISLQRHQKYLGFSVDKIKRIDPIFQERLTPPASGIIEDNDIEYLYAKYYFQQADGFVHTNTIMANAAHQMREDIIAISDPLRNCSVYGRFADLDAVSSWTYTNPDPKAMLFTETLMTAAQKKQKVISTITLWNYAGTLVPSEKDRFARDKTLCMEPDRYKECAWLNFSRGVDAIGSYFGSPIEPALRDGDPFIFSPKTLTAINEFAQEIVKPFGELAKKTTPSKRRVAVLDSFASRVYGNSPIPYNHYPNYTVYNFYTILNMAHFEADILFDESINKEVLAKYDMLVLPCCDVLPRAIYDAILAFEKSGGIVVADNYLRADIPNVIKFDFDFEYRKNVNANANVLKSDFAIKDDTNFRKEWGGNVTADGVTAQEDQDILENYTHEFRRVIDPIFAKRDIDCSTPNLLIHRREYNNTQYIFVTNDHRTYGDRVGKYLSMLERGVATSGTIKLLAPEGDFTLYELVSNKEINYSRCGEYIEFNIDVPAASGAIIAIFNDNPKELKVVDNKLFGTFNKGLQPVKLEWSSNGKISDYSNYYLIIDGVLPLPNRHEGDNWRLEVTNLFDGTKNYF